MRPGRRQSRRRAAPSHGAPRFRRLRIPGSVVELLYDDSDLAPGWQERRLQRHLVRLFPAGCGLLVAVDVAWSEAHDAWELRRATVVAGMAGRHDAAASLRESLRADGLPVL